LSNRKNEGGKKKWAVIPEKRGGKRKKNLSTNPLP